MTKKLTATKQGYDAETETDPNNFIFHSDYNTFKIVASGVASFSVPDGSTLKDCNITHGMPYTPLAYAFALPTDGTRAVVPNEFLHPTGHDDTMIFDRVQVDDSKVHFYMSNNSGSDIDVDVSWFLFEVPL